MEENTVSISRIRKPDMCALKQESNDLKKLQKILQDSLKKAPEGAIHSELAKRKYPQYYWVKKEGDGQPKKRYLKKKEKDLIHGLIKKEYEEKLQSSVVKRIAVIENFISEYNSTELDPVYDSLPACKKCLVAPYTLSNEEYIEKWNESFGEEKNTYPITNGILTEKGEIVRSKSEKMIADKLFYRNVPYVYEPPLYLEQGKIIYPDFALLNVRKRETIYLEHFGIMDDSEYFKRAMEKLEKYAQKRIFPGRGLLITMESESKPLNMAYLDKIIDDFLS